jgi:putative peptide zinc metalloprotease protein
VINTPRIMGTAYDSFLVQYHKVGHAFHGGSALAGVIGIVQMAILVLPAVAIVATFWLLFRRTAGAVWTRTEGKPAARGAFLAAAAAAFAFLGYIWWPNGDYKAIQPGERGTLQGAVHQFGAVPSGHPAAPKPTVTDTSTRTPQPAQQQPRTQTQTPTVTNQTTATSPTPTDTTATTTETAPTTTTTPATDTTATVTTP